MMDQNIETIFSIASYRNTAYIVFLLVALMVERKVSSIIVTLLILTIGENSSNALTHTLLELARQPGLEYKFVWYGSWTLYSLISIYLIYLLHVKLKLRASSGAKFLSLMMLIFALFQIIDFVDRATWDSAYFAVFYQYGIVIGNLLITPMLLFFWLRDIHKERFKKYEEA